MCVWPEGHFQHSILQIKCTCVTFGIEHFLHRKLCPGFSNAAIFILNTTMTNITYILPFYGKYNYQYNTFFPLILNKTTFRTNICSSSNNSTVSAHTNLKCASYIHNNLNGWVFLKNLLNICLYLKLHISKIIYHKRKEIELSEMLKF